MRATITFGRILGIPIGANASWFLVLALVTWSLAEGYFPASYPGWTAGTYWIVAAVTSLLFFGSVVVHELGHSVVARREGVPVRAITLFIFGGVSQITREPPTAGSEFRIAIAGPLTSIGLGVVFGALGALLAPIPVLAAPAVYLGRINLFLGVFNLLPGFPLDGGRILRALIWARGRNFRTATRWASNVGHAVAFVFILLGVGQMVSGHISDGLWIAFLGWFLHSAAEASYQQVVLDDMQRGVTARELMTREWPVVPPDEPLDRLVHDHVLTRGEPWSYVGKDGSVAGVITLRDINAVPQPKWPAVTTGQAMTPLAAVPQARPGDTMRTVLQRMDDAGVEQLPLVEDGRVVGTVSREQLLRYLRTRSEFMI